jgi:hypothetical protein
MITIEADEGKVGRPRGGVDHGGCARGETERYDPVRFFDVRSNFLTYQNIRSVFLRTTVFEPS